MRADDMTTRMPAAQPPLPVTPGVADRVAAPPRARVPRIRPLEWATYGVVLSYVWRLQDLYPILATIQFPTLISLVALGLFAASPARRELRRFRHPILRV